MKGKCFVDTNILVYAHDTSTGAKNPRAKALLRQLWESGQGAISTQVLQEFCVTVQRKAQRKVPPAEMRRLIQDYLSWEIVINRPDSVLLALDIAERYSISFWDALILQAAESVGAEVLYSEDLAHGQKYGPVRVLDPFKAEAS